MAQGYYGSVLRGLLIFVSSIGLFGHWNETVPWWGALLVFFAPDLSFLGYLRRAEVWRIPL